MLPRRLLTRLAAPLVALGVALALAPPAQAANPETTITSGPQDGALLLPGPVQYTFVSDVGGSTFQCSVDNAAYAACVSPVSYDLPPGGHVFRVRAVDSLMTPDPTPPARIWTVRNVPCEQAGEAYRVAQGKFFEAQQLLVKAKKQLHRTKNHGSAAQLQHAKNKVKRIKGKVFRFRTAMSEAIAQENAVC